MNCATHSISYRASLLDIWLKSGLLAHDGDGIKYSNLLQAIKECLPTKYHQRWKQAINECPLLTISGWDGSVSVSEMSRISSVADVVIVKDECAEVEFSFDENTDEILQSIEGKDVSVCRLQTVGYAQIMKKATELACKHIEPGDSYQTIWNLRFRTLAAAHINPIKKINIVDRYAISQFMNPWIVSASGEGQERINDIVDELITLLNTTATVNNEKQHKSEISACVKELLQSMPKSTSGLERFLLLLDESATGPRSVEICSAWTKDLLYGESAAIIKRVKDVLRYHPNNCPKYINDEFWSTVKAHLRKDINDIAYEISQTLNRLPFRNVTRVVVYMVKDACFRKQSHDRFIRFGRYVWNIGLGLKIFEGECTKERSNAFFTTETNEFKAIERILKNVKNDNAKGECLVERRVIDVSTSD
jgi:hypothetical protein